MGKEGCSFLRLFNILLSLAFLGAGGYLIWYFLGQPDASEVKDAFGSLGDFRDVLGNISDFKFGDFYDNDPFLSDNSTSAWPTSGKGGLTLEIINALDDTWQTEFTEAISDWDNGDPDALTLKVTRGDVDYNCTVIDGVQKVCNANFGETGWLGINVIQTTVATGEIVSSIAKMNEYYLRNAKYEERQYTMCHEIGHGFGLPHTDENFNNPPLGNCLDYTNQPEANMHPDGMNFRRLASMYGTVSQRRLGRSKDPSAQTRTTRKLSAERKLEFNEALQEIEQLSFRRSLSENTVDSLWQLVDYHPKGSRYWRALGEEHTIEVYMLHGPLAEQD